MKDSRIQGVPDNGIYVSLRPAEGGGRMAEDRYQGSEGGDQEIGKGGGLTTENTSQKSEIRGQRTENRN